MISNTWEVSKMKFSFLAFHLMLFVAQPAFSEAIGTVSASFDGGDARTYYAMEEAAESQSFWTQTLPGTLNASSFSIWANPDDTANVTDDVIVLGGTLIRAGSEYMVVAELEYLERYFSEYWTNPEEGAVSVTMTKVEEDGERLVLEGTYEATVFYTTGASNPQTDMSRSKTIAGSFSVRLPKD